jgi:hypothetical protein
MEDVLKSAALPCATTKEGGDALLMVFKLQYKSLGESAFVAEIRMIESVTLKTQLEESLRITEVPSEHAE